MHICTVQTAGLANEPNISNKISCFGLFLKSYRLQTVARCVLILTVIQNEMKLRGICMGIPPFCIRVSAS